MVLEKQLRVLHPDPQAAGRERISLDLARAFETSKPTPSDRLPPTMSHLLILLILSNSDIVTFTGDQAFRSMSLWGPFSFKPPHSIKPDLGRWK